MSYDLTPDTPVRVSRDDQLIVWQFATVDAGSVAIEAPDADAARNLLTAPEPVVVAVDPLPAAIAAAVAAGLAVTDPGLDATLVTAKAQAAAEAALSEPSTSSA